MVILRIVFFSSYRLFFGLVSSKMSSSSGQLVQRIRLYDEEEHPTQNNIMIDDDLVQYYQLLADRGDAQAQVRSSIAFAEEFIRFLLVRSRSIVLPSGYGFRQSSLLFPFSCGKWQFQRHGLSGKTLLGKK